MGSFPNRFREEQVRSKKRKKGIARKVKRDETWRI